MLNNAWMRAREKADLKQVRVHDLKHTFGRRLRAAGVSFEVRQDLWGIDRDGSRHTTQQPSLSQLIEAADQCTNRAAKNPSGGFAQAQCFLASRKNSRKEYFDTEIGND